MKITLLTQNSKKVNPRTGTHFLHDYDGLCPICNSLMLTYVLTKQFKEYNNFVHEHEGRRQPQKKKVSTMKMDDKDVVFVCRDCLKAKKKKRQKTKKRFTRKKTKKGRKTSRSRRQWEKDRVSVRVRDLAHPHKMSVVCGVYL